MKTLIYLLLLAALSSCMTAGRIQRNCDKFVQVCGTETKTEIRFRDTLVYLDPIPVRLPVSDIHVSLSLRVIDGKVNLPMQSTIHGLITTDVSIVDNELVVHAYLNDSTILAKPKPVLIKDGIREEEKSTVVPVKHIPGFYKFTFWLFVAQALAALFFLISSLRRIGIKSILQPVLSLFSKKGDV
ncbi:hypothetical protein [Sunxiuqinia sp. sy24]|uniref:hypothetical protein n=1 Tax=Sunxiuqinia sp. sy24 TaxID=3461495 RepID=UPI0040453D02